MRQEYVLVSSDEYTVGPTPSILILWAHARKQSALVNTTLELLNKYVIPDSFIKVNGSTKFLEIS